MRVALILDCDTFGGTRTYAEMLLALLHRQGYSLFALIPKPLQQDAVFIALLHTFHVVWKPYPKRTGFFARRWPFAVLWEWWHTVPWLLRVRPRLLIIFHGSPGQWVSLFALPVRIFHILHTCVMPPGRLERYCSLIFLSFLNSRKVLYTVSAFAAAQIKKYWHVDAAYIYNPTRFPQVVDMLPDQSPARHIVTLAFVADFKNPYVWLTVARRVLAIYPEVTFTWYGDGVLLEHMRMLAHDIHNVHFAGYTADAQSCYAAADIYFQPSILESHGIAVLEAMSFGLPCVVSDAGGLPESVKHGVTGFVLDINDAQGMADALCRLIASPEECQQFGRAAQATVREHFMPAVWEARTKAALTQVVSCPS